MTSPGRTIELYVNGMTCGHCAASVTEELEEIAGVKNVEVILVKDGTSKVSVIADVEIDDDALRDAVTEAGYELLSIERA